MLTLLNIRRIACVRPSTYGMHAVAFTGGNKEQGKQEAHRNGENESAPAGERSATAPDTSVDSAHPWVFRESREKQKDNVEPREKQTHTDGQ